MQFDTDDKAVEAEMQNLDRTIQEKLIHFREKYVGKMVRIVRGWRVGEKGAKAIIDGVIFYNGEVWFLCMATNRRGEKINGDAWTREYRPVEDFELLAEGNTRNGGEE